MTGPLSDDALTAEWWAAVEAVTSLCKPEIHVIPNCRCGHGAFRHAAEAGPCMRRACGCRLYRTKESK